MKIVEGWLSGVVKIHSPFCDERPNNVAPSLLVIHNISLPPGEFGNDYITQLFTGNLRADEHPYFADIAQLHVSAHCLIRRTGEIIQYVPFNLRAWHAGVSSFNSRDKCNDFSIGIELEGTDSIPYTQEQYDVLLVISELLLSHYPITLECIKGHCDIAPERKTDPGMVFNWSYYKSQLAKRLNLIQEGE